MTTIRVLLVVLMAPAVSALSGLAQTTKPTTQTTLLQQVQAADLLAQLLTWHCDRMNARVDAMHQYLQEKDLLDDFAQNPPQPGEKRLAYDRVYEGTLQFLTRNSGKYADPGFARLKPGQLHQELSALQSYNMKQYLYLNRQRDQADSMRAYLEQHQQFQPYLAWAGNDLQKLESTTQPATRPADVAVKLEQLPPAMKNPNSPERKSIANRIGAITELARSLQGGSQPRQAAPAGFHAQANPNNQGIALLQPNDPRWDASYYQPDPANWDNWGDSFSDVYHPRGGVYRSYDQRLNQDYDLRVQGEEDRRTNVDFDRRQNIRIDPRQRF